MVVLVVLTAVTHLPFVLLLVALWVFVGHRRWHRHHGPWDTGWRGQVHG